ncbi:MAG: VOC family protein [Dehalococcoidia bacterium]
MDLDHVIVAVAELDTAIERYEALLGRPAAARSKHPRGTRNALFLFEQGPYLELLAPWDAPETGSSAGALRERLEKRDEGLDGIALTSDDLDETITELRERGLDLADAVANSGVNADGRVREWRATRLPAIEGGHAYLVQHSGWDLRRELLTQPPRDRAAGAVNGIHHVAYDVADAATSSATCEHHLGLPRLRTIQSARMAARVFVHGAGDAAIEFVDSVRADGPVAARIARAGHGLSSLAFEVRELEAAVQQARTAGVAVGDPEPGVLSNSRVARIDPASACGVSAQYLQFS